MIYPVVLFQIALKEQIPAIIGQTSMPLYLWGSIPWTPADMRETTNYVL